MLGWAAYALLIVSMTWRLATVRTLPDVQGPPQALIRAAAVWVQVAGILAVLLGLKAAFFPQGSEERLWAAAAIAIASGAGATMAVWRRREGWAFAAALGTNLAASLLVWYFYRHAENFGDWWLVLLQANVLCLAVGSTAWSLLRATHRSGVPHPQLAGRPLPFAHVAAVVAVGLLGAVAAAGAASDLWRLPHLHVDIGRLAWLAWGAAAIAVAICLWDAAARFVFGGLYFLGLSAMGMAFCAADLAPRQWCWWATSAVAGCALAAAVCGWLLPRSRATCRALRIPDRPQRWPVAWFMEVQTYLVAAAAVLGAWISLDVGFDGIGEQAAIFGVTGRLAGNLGALMLVGTTIVMAAQATAPWRARWQYAAFAAGLLLAGSLGWARLDPAPGAPTGDAPWLHRGVILMSAAAVMLLIGTLGLRWILPKKSAWIAAGRRCAPVFGGLTLLTLLAVLARQWALFNPTEIQSIAPWVAPWAIAIVAVVMVGLITGCLALAVVPQWDPLRLSDRGRTVYVYAAEVLLALLGVHLRITMPWLFHHGIIKTYWMQIVMAIAFCGAALSEVFHRRKMPVLSEPLERTALLLPLWPPIWLLFVKNYDSASMWFLGGSGPALWLLMGLFYCVMAISKRSLALAALAILTGNTGLWVLWHRCGLSFYDRPQLWLIPIALAVLVAEHLDRRRLSDAQRAAIRYVALSVIYVSSTTEFWRGIGQSVALPLVTIFLAVLGVLAGILLRVRSFLYLGVTFLLVVIVRMIVYAAFEQEQIWIFWACCILLGAAIIALFAVFEKRRNDVLAAMQRFKQWQR